MRCGSSRGYITALMQRLAGGYTLNTIDQSLAELSRTISGATAVFHKYRLDFCCGGKHTLKDAAAKRNLDAAAIASELEHLAAARSTSEEDQLSGVSDTALIAHILTRYHEVHRQQLPELIRLASRVELVHAEHVECPTGLSHHLMTMQKELEEHMQKEEQILFPMISRGMQGAALQPVSIMRSDHDDHGEALEKMIHLAHDLNLPPGACNTWQALYLGLDSFTKDLMDHIHLENNILFDRIDGMPDSHSA